MATLDPLDPPLSAQVISGVSRPSGRARGGGVGTCADVGRLPEQSTRHDHCPVMTLATVTTPGAPRRSLRTTPQTRRRR